MNPPRPPPKKSAKSNPPPVSVQVYVRAPPGPAPPCASNAACPNWSYVLRFWASESTSYASVASLNFAGASAALFTSGWYLRASLRYAALTWSAVASRRTPSTS